MAPAPYVIGDPARLFAFARGLRFEGARRSEIDALAKGVDLAVGERGLVAEVVAAGFRE